MPASWTFAHPSQRMPVLAEQVVATSQPLASQAGLDALRRGGNAVDAIVAAAATLTVVEPTSNGLGSDAFAIVSHGTDCWGLNASGRAPAGLDPDRFLAAGAMPQRGWDSVTVPGAISAWVALSERWGRLGLDALVEPAARYAEHGWPVGPVTAAAWARAAHDLARFDGFAAAFLPGGRAPLAGERMALPAQAAALRAIGASAGAAFYRGDLAARIAAAATADGAAFTAEDLARHAATWVTPISREAYGLDVAELPPNGQGIAALSALGILAHTDHANLAPDDPRAVHLAIEATKCALRDVHDEVADPEAMRVGPADLLDPDRLAAHAAGIDPDHVGPPAPATLPPGGTVYLAAADADGMLVSYIQSNYVGFGSGIVVDGVALHNRGAGFSTDPGHPNVVAPAKRPFHTIIPALAQRAGEGLLAFGVMGGHMQPQGHLQVLTRIAAQGENPQAAVDAPRWRVDRGLRVGVEQGLGRRVIDGLQARGHEVTVTPPGIASGAFGFGGAQVIQRLDAGVWLAASDPRKEGAAVGF